MLENSQLYIGPLLLYLHLVYVEKQIRRRTALGIMYMMKNKRPRVKLNLDAPNRETVDEQMSGRMDNRTDGDRVGRGGVMFHAADRRRMTNAPLCSCPR